MAPPSLNPAHPNLEDGECLICGSRDRRLVVRSPDLEYRCREGTWDLVACVRCGHVYVHPLPRPDEIAGLYPPWYYTVNRRSPIYLDGPVVSRKLVRDARWLRAQLGDLTVRSFVDVGGGNLSRLVKIREVFGPSTECLCLDLQFDAQVLDQARREGIVLLAGNVETDVGALRDGGHDVIVMRQLIEHLRDPRAALRGLRAKLAPHGVLVIDTPNRGGLDYLLFKSRYWGGYHIPRHFHLFTRASLHQLLGETGFAIRQSGYLPSLAFWIISLRNALGLNSVERGPSFWEFLHLKNLAIAGGFFLLDLITLRLGIPSSNQFVIAGKDGG